MDAAQLSAQMMVPVPIRPGWAEALAMERSVVPYERLLSVDVRLEGAAARPVITPQTIVVDQGNVFVSSSFIAACESRPWCPAVRCGRMRCDRRRRPERLAD
uniref:hypothetical protein n=1 Tax=Streptomyces cinerochromogenes TaxID=66422 RepID=UPI003571746D